ncbi:MAG: T9SS type A sorting domain-containing protein [Bacteroidetes bacterium]|nr:T9SS type A sorting domain-containing protein [Bacteroidota bacterium]
MKMSRIIFSMIVMIITCTSIISQVTQYKVISRTSAMNICNVKDTGVTLLNRVEYPFVGVTSDSSITLTSGKYFGDETRYSLVLDDNLMNPDSSTEQLLPDEFILYSNYPNPFNLSTTISYFLPKKTSVVIKIYKILGQEICTILQEEQSAGEKSVIWDGRNLSGQIASSGVYICRIITGKNSKSIKMLLMK